MLSALRSLWTWTAILVLIVVWLPWLALVRVFDRDPAYYRTGRWFRRLGKAMTRVNPAWRVRISGDLLENPRNPYVVVSNHQSLADVPIISCLPWEMKWVTKAELFRVPLVGWMLRLAGDLRVDRNDTRSRAKVLMEARQYLQKKCSVIFFPEGTRSPDGRVLPFTDGAFRLAIKEQVPILPLAIEGTQDTLPKHSWRFGAPRLVHLKVLPPVATAGLKAADAEALRDRVRRQIMEQVAVWRGVPVELVDGSVQGEIIKTA
jgi:1-acyl-sn-glycerol-3-phosphate acyltransferase